MGLGGRGAVWGSGGWLSPCMYCSRKAVRLATARRPAETTSLVALLCTALSCIMRDKKRVSSSRASSPRSEL